MLACATILVWPCETPYCLPRTRHIRKHGGSWASSPLHREGTVMAARDLGADLSAGRPSERELPAAVLAILAAGVLIGLIYLGSRGLRDFDSALVGYAVGTVFAVAAIVYRYT